MTDDPAFLLRQLTREDHHIALEAMYGKLQPEQKPRFVGPNILPLNWRYRKRGQCQSDGGTERLQKNGAATNDGHSNFR